MGSITLNKPSGGQLTISPEDGATNETVTIPSVGVGKVLQVVEKVRNSDFLTTSSTPTDIDTIQITPKSPTSKIIMYINYNHGQASGGYSYGQLINNTQGNIFCRSPGHYSADHADGAVTRATLIGVDYPATTATQTYAYRGWSSGIQVWFHTFGSNAESVITLTEVEV